MDGLLKFCWGSALKVYCKFCSYSQSIRLHRSGTKFATLSFLSVLLRSQKDPSLNSFAMPIVNIQALQAPPFPLPLISGIHCPFSLLPCFPFLPCCGLWVLVADDSFSFYLLITLYLHKIELRFPVGVDIFISHLAPKIWKKNCELSNIDRKPESLNKLSVHWTRRTSLFS